MLEKLQNIDVTRELCKRSFYYFFCEFWSVIESDQLFINWHIPYLCGLIQEIGEGVIRGEKVNEDLVVNICPGTSKSTIVSIMLPAWLWIRKPDCVTLCNTISSTNATKFSLKFRDIVTSEKYQKLFPYIKIRQDSTAFMRIQNTSGGARRQYTTKSSITGDHGHIRLDDDQMDFQSARSDAEVERCIDGFKAYSTRAKKNAYVPYILVMQRLSNQDTSTYVFEKMPNIKKIVLPAWDNGKIFPIELKENYINGLLNPNHISKEKLEKEKLKLGDLQYLSEYGQDCETSEGYLYNIQKVAEIENKGVKIAITDPADDGDCYNASMFGSIYNNKIWINDIIYCKDPSEIMIPRNIKKAKEFKPYAFHCEKDGIGSMFGKQINAKYPLVRFFNSKENKYNRIFSKSNIVSKHVIFLENSPNMEYENAVNHIISYKRVGQNKYKDIEDCLTSLVEVAIKNGLINPYI